MHYFLYPQSNGLYSHFTDEEMVNKQLNIPRSYILISGGLPPWDFISNSEQPSPL